MAPVPTDEAVGRFRELCRSQLGLELSEEEARDATTRLLQIRYLITYAHRYLREKDLGNAEAGGSRPRNGSPDAKDST